MATPPRKRPGRPPLDPADTSTVSVHLKMRPSDFATTVARATRNRETLAAYIRRRLRAPGDDPERGPA